MLEIKNVFKSFNDNEVLKGVDLTIENNSIHALLGANGAGKSTLVNIVSGIMYPDSGNVYMDNEEITPKKHKHKAKTGYVFETPVYIENFKLYDFLLFASELYNIEKNTGKRRIKDLTDFFELPMNKRIYTFSKGMKAKVSFALALLNNPKYLILDEAFEGMDFLSINKLQKYIKTKQQNNGLTVLITSHQIDLILSFCDTISLLKNGKIAFTYPVDYLNHIASQTYPGTIDPIKHLFEVEITKQQ